MWIHQRWEILIRKLLVNYPESYIVLIGQGNASYIHDLCKELGENSRVVNLQGKTTLNDLVALCHLARILITCNSGPAHIAYLLKTPLVVIASGTNTIGNWFPANATTVALQKQTSCFDCQREICYKERHLCMEKISASEVLAKISTLMGQRQHGRKHVFFDARMITHPGIGRYIRSLLPLLHKSSDVRVTVLGQRQEIKKFLGGDAEVIDFTPPIYSAQEQIGYKRIAKKIAKGILHIPHYNIPFFADSNLVATLHDLIHVQYPQGARSRLAAPYMRWMVARMVKNARRIVCVSHATEKCLSELFSVDLSKVSVIHEGVAREFSRINDFAYLTKIKEKYNLPEKFILYVGSIRKHKNIDMLLDAFGLLRKRMPELCLVLVGRVAYSGNLKREGVIVLEDTFNDRDLCAIYNLATCFCNLSLYEGFGLTILEAQKCGTPVVCSGILPHREVGGRGILPVAPHNIDQIAESLYNVLHQDRIRSELVQEGFENTERFSWIDTAQATTQIYQEIPV